VRAAAPHPNPQRGLRRALSLRIELMRSPGRWRNTLARILVGIALIVLASGLMLMAGILTGIGTEPIVTPEQAEGAAIFLFFLWPSVLVIALIFGIAALLVAQQSGISSLVVASFLAWIGVQGGLYLIAHTVPGGSSLPMKGSAVGLVVALFFCIVLGASYWAWHSILNGTRSH
jgi:hypothetical protein